MNEVKRRVVVGVDRSTEGEAALEVALREALDRGLPLVAVRAWADPVTAGYPLGAVLVTSGEEAEQSARRTAEEMVKTACERVPGADGVDVGVRAVRGPAGPVLVECSRDAALLVVGTRSAGVVARTVLGSVAEHAVHHADCPVVVVPAPATPGPEPARVVVGVDHSPASRGVLAFAAEVAAGRGAVLVPVLAYEPPPDASRSLTDLEAAERRSLHDAVPAAEALRVEPQVVAGQPGRRLVGLARPQDLLVVGTRGRGAAVGALLGSTSTWVLRHASCPVVVVRSR